MKPASNTPHEWSEDRLQSEFFRWFNNTYPEHRGCLFSVPNGANKGGVEAKRFKATGLWAGAADLIFAFKRECHFIELKRPDGKGYQSDDQKAFQDQMEKNGFAYFLYNDLEELKDLIMTIIAYHKINERKIDLDNYPHKQLGLFDE